MGIISRLNDEDFVDLGVMDSKKYAAKLVKFMKADHLDHWKNLDDLSKQHREAKEISLKYYLFLKYFFELFLNWNILVFHIIY